MKYIVFLVVILFFTKCKKDENIIVFSTNKVDNIFLSGRATAYPTDAIKQISERFNINNENFSNNVKYTIVNNCIVFIVELVESKGTELYFSNMKIEDSELVVTLCSKENEEIQGVSSRFFVVAVKANVQFNNSLKIKMLDCEK